MIKKEEVINIIEALYIQKMKEKFHHKINYSDILSCLSKEYVLPMPSSEEDPNVLKIRNHMFSKSKELKDNEKNPGGGYYAFYFSKLGSLGFVNIRFHKDNIYRGAYNILKNPTHELEQYIKVFGLPTIYILEKVNEGEACNERRMDYYKENLRPEIGRNKVLPSHARKEIFLICRREAIKEQAIWKGYYEKLLLNEEKYENCIYMLQMSDGRIYVGCTTEEVLKRIKKHIENAKAQPKEYGKKYNIYLCTDLEKDFLNMRVYIFPPNLDLGTLEENEEKLIQFIYPELNTLI